MAGKGPRNLKGVISLLFRPGVNLPNCVTLCGTLIILLAVFEPSSSELASWVQAIGSIAAIYGAFWISKRQSDADKLNRKEVEHAKASSIKGLIAAAPELVKHIVGITHMNVPNKERLRVFKGAWEAMFKHQLDAVMQSIKSIPAHELGSFDLVNCFNGIRGGLEMVLVQAESLNNFDIDSAHVESEFLFGALHMGEAQVQVAWEGYKEIYKLKFD